MKIYQGMQISNETKGYDYLVCYISRCQHYVAMVDLINFKPTSNLKKPTVWRYDDVKTLINHRQTKVESYVYPVEMTRSDNYISNELGKPNWLKKRDNKFNHIRSLTEPKALEEYLFGQGASQQIKSLMENSFWSNKTQFYSALNRFIVFGCTKNALLPFSLKNCGSNYRHVKDLDDVQIKRGPKKLSDKKIRSKARGINDEDKKNIKKTLAYVKREFSNFSIQLVYQVYHRTFERYRVEWEVPTGQRSCELPLPEQSRISEGMFHYHCKNILSRADLKRIKFGDVNFAKDHEDKQGKAYDGVMGATHRYEVDATILNCYVRFPYDTEGRYTMGRPVLYLVVDVYSTAIVGMYLGFDGPNWKGVAQALVNACLDKVEFAKRYGVHIKEHEWPAKHIPTQISIDNGVEYPEHFLDGILNSRIGVEIFNLLAVYRGDRKGTGERKFRTLDDSKLKHLPGALPENPKRGEAHASNFAFYDYNGLMEVLISEICYHNTTADRVKRLNMSGLIKGIDITPAALFQHSLEDVMEGGRPTGPEDEARIRWAFMPEEYAKVRKDCVFFKGVEYHHPYFKSSKSYLTARHHGTYDIMVKRMYDLIDEIWHQTKDGRFIKLKAKNINNENPLVGKHWEIALAMLEDGKDKSHANAQNALFQRAFWDAALGDVTDENKAILERAPANTRKSIQPGIEERKALQKLVQMIENHHTLDKAFGTATANTSRDVAESVYMDDYDEELFGD